MLEPYLLGCAFILVSMVALWLYSLRTNDVSHIDIFWGLAFVGAAWVFRLADEGPASTVQWLHLALVTVWGVRLALHIGVRHHHSDEEDYRYRAMRDKSDNFRMKSLVRVFGLQGVLASVIAVPLLFTQAGQRPAEFTAFDLAAIAVWCVGFFFESVGDYQLGQFRAEASNRGKVLNTGLWRYTRHPNYFGDAAQWWAYGLFALSSVGGYWALPSVALMTFFLLKVSGVALLEKTISNRRPAYREYIERTSAFFPWPPKAGRTSGEPT